MKLNSCVLASIFWFSVVCSCSVTSTSKPSFDEFDCAPNAVEKLINQTIRDLFIEIKYSDAQLIENSTLRSFLDECVCVLKSIDSTVKNFKLATIFEYHKSRLIAICDENEACMNDRKCIEERTKYANETLSELFMSMAKTDSVAFLQVIQSIGRKCGELKRTIDMFYTPNELLESFKCVFNSIDVAVKGTHLTAIWDQYKALLEKIRGEIEVCIRDQSGEEQQKCVDGKIKEGVPILDKLFIDMQKKNLHDFLCVLNNVDRNCDEKGFNLQF